MQCLVQFRGGKHVDAYIFHIHVINRESNCEAHEFSIRFVLILTVFTRCVSIKCGFQTTDGAREKFVLYRIDTVPFCFVINKCQMLTSDLQTRNMENCQKNRRCGFESIVGRRQVANTKTTR